MNSLRANAEKLRDKLKFSGGAGFQCCGEGQSGGFCGPTSDQAGGTCWEDSSAAAQVVGGVEAGLTWLRREENKRINFRKL